MFNSHWSGFHEITPVMTKPNGQKVLWTQVVADGTNQRQAEPDPEPAQVQDRKPALATLVVLGLPLALLIARAISF